MKKATLLLILFLLGNAWFAEARTYHIDCRITPSDISNGYAVTRVWLDQYAKPLVRLSHQQYTPVTIAAGALISDNASPDILLGMERKRPFAIVRIPAYCTDGELQLMQLTSVRLTITETPAETSPPSTLKTTASSSILATGTWYKIAVKDAGVYKIDYAFIKNKLGVDPATINPTHIRLFGNGGTMLPEDNAVSVHDDLIENAIEVTGEGDGVFHEQDYFLFYATGPVKWEKDSIGQAFRHVQNLYTDSSYYFLCFDLGSGRRVGKQSGVPAANVIVTDFNDYMVHEEDLINVSKFGKEWWGEEFSPEPGRTDNRTFSFHTGVLTDAARIRLMLGSRSFASGNTFSLQLNGVPVTTFNFGKVLDDAEAIQMTLVNQELTLPVSGTTSTLHLKYMPGIYSGKGYLNYIEWNTRRLLAITGGQLSFRDWRSVGVGNIAGYAISNAGSNTSVWEVTDPLRPLRMNVSFTPGAALFSREAERLREFIAFDGSFFATPEFVGQVANQNLHGMEHTDMIIVTHPSFKAAADKLAHHHTTHDGLRTVVATTTEVYNEFSSGGQDISAIRNFARMFYKRAGTDTTEIPRYLLLLGDASYDYKDRVNGNTNFVPTYETAESVNPLSGYCSDDFFTFLDDNENMEADVINTMDISVGRFPVASATAAMEVVDKTIHYTSPASLGSWRVSTTIMSDNGDHDVHYYDGEIMSDVINEYSNLYNETKVHLSAIPTVSTPAGTRAPEANKMINDQVFKGTFLMNYNGHGSIYTLTSERILTQDDFNTWKNKDKLPIMVTATCEFSRFDNPDFVSAGEKLILKPDGGAIALLTTTQLVYQQLNRPMNINFLAAQFRQYNGKWIALGDALRYSKNKTYAVVTNQWDLGNYRKFALLGDPAVVPAFPEHQIYVTEVVDEHTLLPADTIKALGKYAVKGKVTNTTGQILHDFNGRLNMTIYDKPRNVNTLSDAVKTFQVQNNIVYRGTATVTNGVFSVTFITPKDLNYEFGKGKISLYAENGITDAAGADTTAFIGGFSDNPVEEDTPPIVKPFIGDSLFRDGGITGASTMLYVQLYDETGINVSGNSIGHDLTAILDGNIQQPYILNDYYETAPNDYRKGYVYFPVSGLSDGMHNFRVKAWDANNNSGEGVVNFRVVNGRVVEVTNLMNYPNPFSDQTHFVFEHNHPETPLDVTIQIYSTAGYQVRTIKQQFTPTGSRSNEITWDGTSDTGAKLPSGLYVYKLSLATEAGIMSTAYQKLVLIR